MQTENDDDLDGGQRSSEVKWGKLCDMATIINYLVKRSADVS